MSSDKAAAGGRIAALEAEVERLQNVLRIATEAPRLTGMEALIADRDCLVAQNAALRTELDIIANATPSQWEPDMRDQFQAWAQNRARQAAALSATPTSAEAGTGREAMAWMLRWAPVVAAAEAQADEVGNLGPAYTRACTQTVLAVRAARVQEADHAR